MALPANVPIHLGIDNIKKVLALIFDEFLAAFSIDGNHDGTISTSEWIVFISSQFGKLLGSGIFPAVQQTGPEIRDLSDAEFIDLVNWSQANFPSLPLGKEKLGNVIRLVFGAVGSLYALYDAIKGLSDTAVNNPAQLDNSASFHPAPTPQQPGLLARILGGAESLVKTVITDVEEVLHPDVNAPLNPALPVADTAIEHAKTGDNKK